jgi:SAM-dependent methyltransferase
MRRGAGPAAPGPPSAGAPEERQTLLLPLLLEGLDAERPISVLDVGPGVGETVGFFSRYRCRLHFADLLDDLLAAAQPAEAAADEAEAHYRRRFEELFAFAADTRFDVVLLWDFLNYLPLPALRAFGLALAPYLPAHARGHGFGAFKASAPSAARSGGEPRWSYGVKDLDRLVARPRADTRRSYAHSRTVLADAFSCFEIARGTLLRDGAMELLFQVR